MVKIQAQVWAPIKNDEDYSYRSDAKYAYKRIGWYDELHEAVRAVLVKTTFNDHDTNVKLFRGYNTLLFEGFDYELPHWLKAKHPDQREQLTTPREESEARARKHYETTVDAAKRTGYWMGVWYRGDCRPEKDPFTDWSKLDGCGQHTLAWSVPRSTGGGSEQYVTLSNIVPEIARDNMIVRESECAIPFEWGGMNSEDLKIQPKVRFHSYDFRVDSSHTTQVWYD